MEATEDRPPVSVSPDPATVPENVERERKPWERDVPDSFATRDLYYVLGLFFVAFHFFFAWGALAIPVDAIKVFKENGDAKKLSLARAACAFLIFQLILPFVNSIFIVCTLTSVADREKYVLQTARISGLAFASAWIALALVVSTWSGLTRPNFVNWQIAAATLATIFSTATAFVHARAYYEDADFEPIAKELEPVDCERDPRPLRDELVASAILAILVAALAFANWNLVAVLGDLSNEQLETSGVRTTVSFTVIWIVFSTIGVVFVLMALLPERKRHPTRQLSLYLGVVFEFISFVASLVAFCSQLSLKNLSVEIPESVRKFRQYNAYSMFGWILGLVVVVLLSHVWSATGGSPNVSCAPSCGAKLPKDELEHRRETRRIQRENEVARLDIQRMELEARRRELLREKDRVVESV